MPNYASIQEQHIETLTQLLSAERVSVKQADLDLHARDQSFHEPHAPEVVVWPQNTAEVSALLKFANQKHIPVTAWGAGSSLEGNPMPTSGGIVMNMTQMNKLLAVRPEDFQVDVQPGLTRIELNKALARHGLFFPPDPGANATLGGMIANNASGIKTIKYGATKDNVMRLEVVLASGEVMRVGSLARKDSSGYDLLHLFVGSEGTLGIVTEATLKLSPLPQNFSAVLAAFPDIPSSINTVVDIVSAGLDPSALEFLDTETMHALNVDKNLKFTEAPTIIMEFNGNSDDDGLNAAVEICKDNGAVSFESAAGLEARNRLWEVRHHTYESLLRQHPGLPQLIMDVAVPVSKYPELVAFANDVLKEHNLIGYKFGHAGDGNLHCNIIYDPTSPEHIERAKAANAIIVEHGIELGGTATGEHGIGIGKRKYMSKQHGPAVDLMRQIKQTLDPNWILNPGKIFF